MQYMGKSVTFCNKILRNANLLEMRTHFFYLRQKPHQQAENIKRSNVTTNISTRTNVYKTWIMPLNKNWNEIETTDEKQEHTE